MNRGRITRWAAPVAFLAAITIGTLVVRAGFQQAGHQRAKSPTTTVTSKTKKKKHAQGQKGHHRTYTIQSGDTLGSIAAKTGTTVARLQQLNPGIDPTALRVGQTIRVQ
ncbi:MAG TPA: LysM domain-containing protein [Gaiellaceae bacterium]|nr:LysM domain-containing protein [Gaiellaceae bacterium]